MTGPSTPPIPPPPRSQPPAFLSLNDALAPAPPSTASPFIAWMCDDSDTIFNFTMRKAEGKELGLEVSQQEQQQVLQVEAVQQEPRYAWNTQCFSNGLLEKVIVPGDRIVCVNKILYNSENMLQEIREKMLLRFTVTRSAPPVATLPQCTPAHESFWLRPDAPTLCLVPFQHLCHQCSAEH